MTLGFTSPAPADPAPSPGRTLEPAEWASAGIPLLRDPREVVTGLHARHQPVPGTTVVAILGPDERLVASASFRRRQGPADGWDFRNDLLARLRRVIPHDLRRRTPVRTAVLLCCREGDSGWTPEDGAWMWGLRDACTLHGLRCGAYITLTATGWRVLGEDRAGRRPHSGSAGRPAGGTAGPDPGGPDGPAEPGTASGGTAARVSGGASAARLRAVAR
ncbi:hypothetical protein IHE55_22440 [Streptomyces pactum]|uniref:DUF4192 domain-containing protein n=1 Tax=Streptomyces pactum TaxID=68249 RepID=A0ABS0NQA9_9ACTN|nr:hypothetical protein [Streptomyces pactum]MBH5337368.1 hypothetical protein [Streptomyces pactum]